MSRRASLLGRVESMREPIEDHVLLTVRLPSDAPVPRPGQFMHLRPAGGSGAPLLRRPMSISALRSSGNAWLWSAFFGRVGEGTEILARLPAGAPIEVLGPLGRPYVDPARGDIAVLIGGGRGVAPIVFLAETLAAAGYEAVLLAGARRADLLWVPEACPVDIRLSTDDGSHGIRGTVMDLVEALPQETLRRAAFYACGPHALLARVAAYARERGRPSQVTVEARMGCAMNVCRGCVLPVTDPKRRYATVCTDGPVFYGEELDWPALQALESTGYGVPHGRRHPAPVKVAD
jgi:dihydroorotate dehydrogenase electron transfer subunit